MADQTVAVERALWAAVRSMEEQSEFAHRLAESSRQKHRARLARRFAEKADASREYADTLRELLQRAGEKVEQIPQESANPEQESA
jgi:two-component system chemotaxis response regulator CheB